jgi:hypothetical protein
MVDNQNFKFPFGRFWKTSSKADLERFYDFLNFTILSSLEYQHGGCNHIYDILKIYITIVC